MKRSHAIRVDDTDWAAWQQAADTTGLKLSEWIRRQCNGEYAVHVRAMQAARSLDVAVNPEASSVLAKSAR